ncbi:hypothetical protein FPRO05_14212 [Fusarium proliferatum]|uniref:Protein kinase domain-containing protein n=1 Tax=Gibberella intermedia TaxID=948311 RepID=A0A365MTD8_GIBIN|nr:hypothetical protein FPRO05_14212 [Fusarium proliferatum]
MMTRLGSIVRLLRKPLPLYFGSSDRRRPAKPGMTLPSISIDGPWSMWTYCGASRQQIGSRDARLRTRQNGGKGLYALRSGHAPDACRRRTGHSRQPMTAKMTMMTSPSPTSKPTVGRSGLTTSTDVGSSEMQEHDGSTASQKGTIVRPNIQDRPYCTHECLRGLAFGGPIDEKCPNLANHDSMHITLREFLRLAKVQLAVDRGKDADCVPLYLSGSRGSLFKFRLSCHGYTLVAKGVEAVDTKHLRYENKIYSHVQDLQGKFVPVCLGVVHLIKPYYYDSVVYEDLMFLSYGGRPVLRSLGEVNADITNEILVGLARLHQYGVLHHDAEPRNVLYDKRTGRCMIVDLMLAEFHGRQPLGPINVNGRNRKRKWVPIKHEKDVFAVEA